MNEKPKVKPFNPDALPEKLRNYCKFCNWRYEWDADREQWTKIPYNPKTGHRAKSTDPADFATLEEAITSAPEYTGVGVGIFSNLGAIDIDHCISESGELSEMASDIVSTMDTYTEVSPSGTGLRILFVTRPGFKYDKERYYIKNSKADLEVYLAGMTNRYVTVTGDTRTPGADLETREEELESVINKYMKRPEKKTASSTVSAELANIPDHELHKKALDKDPVFNRLWFGDIVDYESHSEADLALCCKIAFWTGRDPARIDAWFRGSALYRDKWEREDYREKTIQTAVDLCDDVYDPNYRPPDSPSGVNLDTDVEWEDSPFTTHRVSEYLREGVFESDIEYFKKYQFRKTGYINIDKYITLYPGLAALGGGSAVGKSTFAVCFSDNVVERGETVLYFAMEQEAIELVTKSLARKVGEADPHSPIDNIDIKNGATSDTLERVRKEYAPKAENFYLVRCDFTTTAAAIRDYVEEFISRTGIKPIIVVDYLQLVSAPEDFKGDTRGAIDYNIKLFKKMQTKNELFVLMISSFNRAGYDSPISYSDFKESSMIEYTCDFIFGIQLHLVSETRFYYHIGARGGRVYTTEQEKADMIREALGADPRKVQFVCLKNRNGKQNFRCNFFYYPWFDLFISDEKNPFDEN